MKDVDRPDGGYRPIDAETSLPGRHTGDITRVHDLA